MMNDSAKNMFCDYNDIDIDAAKRNYQLTGSDLLDGDMSEMVEGWINTNQNCDQKNHHSVK